MKITPAVSGIPLLFIGISGGLVTAQSGLHFSGPTVSIPACSLNELPDANDDTARTLEDTPITVSVLPNDTGDSLTVYKRDPANGSVVVNKNSSITYTPDPGFTGVDSFEYLVVDGQGGSDSAKVIITVDPNSETEQERVCDILLDAQCAVAPPLVPKPFTCDGDVDMISMRYDGSLGELTSVTAYAGDTSSELMEAVIDGDVVTVSGFALAGAPNDVHWSFTTASDLSGTSVFHISCSDPAMDGETDMPEYPNDCGRPNGDGKHTKGGSSSKSGKGGKGGKGSMKSTNGNGAYDEVWLLNGLRTTEDSSLDCDQPDLQYTSDSCFYNGNVAGETVHYRYKVSNTGTQDLEVTSLFDSELGNIISGPMPLGAGREITFDASATVTGSTTSQVQVVTSEPSGGQECSVIDSITVSATSAFDATPCRVDVAYAGLADDAIVYDLANAGDYTAALRSLVVTYPENEYGYIRAVEMDGVVYQATSSSTRFGSGSTIASSDWTNHDARDRELTQGENGTLTVKFQKKVIGARADYNRALHSTLFSGAADFTCSITTEKTIPSSSSSDY